jgi:hypothetical protein
MGLSEADRAAALRLKAARDEMAPSLRGDLERVLLLAGLEPPEPASGTFWLDEEEGELWVRDDMAATSENDLDRWWCTGNAAKFSWIEVHRVAPKLVELVREDSMGVVVDEMYAVAEALHVKLHGSAPRTMFTCTAPECRFARDTALRHGLIAARWSE